MVSCFFLFSPGFVVKWSNLTKNSYFSTGWLNHQLFANDLCHLHSLNPLSHQASRMIKPNLSAASSRGWLPISITPKNCQGNKNWWTKQIVIFPISTNFMNHFFSSICFNKRGFIASKKGRVLVGCWEVSVFVRFVLFVSKKNKQSNPNHKYYPNLGK